MTKTEMRRRCLALCDECNGFEGKSAKCEDVACPLYPTRARLHDVSDAVDWVALPRHMWPEASLEARITGEVPTPPEPTEAQLAARAEAGKRLRREP